VSKYNQLIRIAEELGPKASYIGKKAFPRSFK
jgi:enolase